MSKETKKCPMCAEMIEQSSKVCPFCKSALEVEKQSSGKCSTGFSKSRREVSSAFLDNFIFKFFRKFVNRLDNALFNGKCCIHENYQPTTRVLLLPYYVGIIIGVYIVYADLFTDASYDEINHYIFSTGWIIVALNIIFLLKHVLVMPTVFKKLAYPVFVAIVTLVFYFTVLVCACLLSFVFFILIVMILLISHGLNQQRQCDKPAEKRVSETVVDDGSFWGKKLTRSSDFENWRDAFGNEYEETSYGFVRRD